jgi:hypothetical protein
MSTVKRERMPLINQGEDTIRGSRSSREDAVRRGWTPFVKQGRTPFSEGGGDAIRRRSMEGAVRRHGRVLFVITGGCRSSREDGSHSSTREEGCHSSREHHSREPFVEGVSRLSRDAAIHH